MSRSDTPFLARWSRRKQQARAGKVAGEPVAAPASEPPPAEAAPAEPLALPDVDSLTPESDFTIFLRAEVPEAIRQAALRKLWRLDPVLAVPDVLDLHNLDYSLPAGLGKAAAAAVAGGRHLVGDTAQPEAERSDSELQASRPEDGAKDAANPPASGISLTTTTK